MTDSMAWGVGHQSSPTRGFTLVEVIVSLAILSLILLATVTALRTFANTQNSIERSTDRLDEMRAVSGFLRNTLGTSITEESESGRLTLGGFEGEPVHFIGGGDYLEWKAVMLFGETYGGVYLVRVGREGNNLVLRWTRPSWKQQESPWESTPSKILVAGLEEFDIAYRPQFGKGWRSAWERRAEPPALVRFQLRSQGRYWPELIIGVPR